MHMSRDLLLHLLLDEIKTGWMANGNAAEVIYLQIAALFNLADHQNGNKTDEEVDGLTCGGKDDVRPSSQTEPKQFQQK